MANSCAHSRPARDSRTPLDHVRLCSDHVRKHAILEDADAIADSMVISVQIVLDDALNHASDSMISLQSEVSNVSYTQFVHQRLTHGPELPSPKP
jgi:hypothetical protein